LILSVIAVPKEKAREYWAAMVSARLDWLMSVDAPLSVAPAGAPQRCFSDLIGA